MDGEELLKSFGKKLGLDLELDDSESCTFSSDSLIITLTYLREIDSIALTADIGEPPAEKLDNLYKMMLEANYLFKATNGATLSINEDNGHIALCRIFECNVISQDKFYEVVERFINISESWSKIVSNYRFKVDNFKEEDKSTFDLPQGEYFFRA